MSQRFAETRHFRKSLDISGNARQNQKHQGFPEMPRQNRKSLILILNSYSYSYPYPYPDPSAGEGGW